MLQGWYVDESGLLKPHHDPKYHDKDHFIQLIKESLQLQTGSMELVLVFDYWATLSRIYTIQN
jgi:hypothetical protein